MHAYREDLIDQQVYSTGAGSSGCQLVSALIFPGACIFIALHTRAGAAGHIKLHNLCASIGQCWSTLDVSLRSCASPTHGNCFCQASPAMPWTLSFLAGCCTWSGLVFSVAQFFPGCSAGSINSSFNLPGLCHSRDLGSPALHVSCVACLSRGLIAANPAAMHLPCP